MKQESTNVGQLLSRTECSVMRGLAILGIFLHNYCHWLGLAVKENEYTFTLSKSQGLLHALTHPDMYLPIHLVSYFGHYGVPVFLFLSGYGLVRKYERPSASAPSRPSPLAFLRVHYLKLFKMMIVGFVAFTMLDMITPQRFHYQAVGIIAQMGMFINLLPNPSQNIWPGPYWFFGLMLQLYVLYRLVFYRWRHWGWVAGFVLACWLLQAFCEPTGEQLKWLRYNCIGGVLPFGMGLLAARHEWTAMAKGRGLLVFLVSSALVFLSCYGFQTWLWTPVFIVTGLVGLVKLLPEPVVRPLDWVGGISAALFVCHPITRKIFIPMSKWGDVYSGLLLYVIASVCLAWVFRKLMEHIPNPKS